MKYELVCSKCGKCYKPERGRYICECGKVLLVEYEQLEWKTQGRGVWRYKSMLPFEEKQISLEEGGTPVINSERIEEELGADIYFKFEGDNPTDSFKDRGSTVAVSRAKQEGFSSVSVASTGNMGASVAAYASHGGLEARVFVPETTPSSKLVQITAYGGKIIKVNGTFSDCISTLWDDVNDGSYLAETGLNPYYIEGEKTLGYEIFEDIGVPDKIIVPLGTGGLLTAIYKAFKELHSLGEAKTLPKMIGVQPEQCSPIVDAWIDKTDIMPLKEAHTIASAVLIKSPFNGRTAINAINDSHGLGVTVSEAEIVKAMKDLGRDGIFCEPSSATTLAALRKTEFSKDEKIVLVITGHGLKDPQALMSGL
ncbi:threonine synthase [archaeon]|nr:threonine synthase [archaeon]